MKSRLKVIIIICIFIIVLISIILLLTNSKNKDTSENIQNNEPGSGKIEATYKTQKLKSIPGFITVNNCVNKYLNYIKEKNNSALDAIFIDEYKKSNPSIKSIEYDCQFNAESIFEYSANINVKTYFVKGLLVNKDDKTIEELLLTINIDYSNNTFELAPFESVYRNYIKYTDFENIELNKEIEKEINNITKNDFNKVEISNGLRRKRNHTVLL